MPITRFSFATTAASSDPMTPNQQKYLFSLAREAGVQNDELEEIVHERFGHGTKVMRTCPAARGSPQVPAI